MRRLTRGDVFKLSSWETLKILEFLDEPNTGLCRVEVRGYEFVVPTVLVRMARDWLSKSTNNPTQGARYPVCSHCGEYEADCRCELAAALKVVEAAREVLRWGKGAVVGERCADWWDQDKAWKDLRRAMADHDKLGHEVNDE